MKSKYYFKQFKDEVVKDHKKFKTLLEEKDVSKKVCDHFGKVKIVDGELRCSCGAGWKGPGVETLFDLFTKNNV